MKPFAHTGHETSKPVHCNHMRLAVSLTEKCDGEDVCIVRENSSQIHKP